MYVFECDGICLWWFVVVCGGGFEKETGGSTTPKTGWAVSSLIDVVIRHEPGDEHRPHVTEY
jgi:hypothetical protein